MSRNSIRNSRRILHNKEAMDRVATGKAIAKAMVLMGVAMDLGTAAHQATAQHKAPPLRHRLGFLEHLEQRVRLQLIVVRTRTLRMVAMPTMWLGIRITLSNSSRPHPARLQARQAMLLHLLQRTDLHQPMGDTTL